MTYGFFSQCAQETGDAQRCEPDAMTEWRLTLARAARGRS
jgi:hypothetical protein